MNRKKILFFANTDWYLYNFKLSLIQRLIEEGWDVVLLSPSGKYSSNYQELGIRWIPLEFSTRSTNPFGELLTIFRVIKLYQQEKPSVVHHFTIKCVIYGATAAWINHRIPTVNSITGLGHLFTDLGVKARILKRVARRLYRLVLGGKKCRVIFQNSNDMNYFINNHLLDVSNAKLIRGSGANINVFKPDASICKHKTSKMTLLFASRLIREKGIFELLQAVKLLVDKGLGLELLIAGDIYPDNPSSLTQDELNKLPKNDVKYLGHVDDIVNIIKSSDIVVLPTYREGTPKILIEAAAMEKPIVATQIPGCEGIVKNNISGYLVPVKNVQALAEAIEKLALDRELRDKMGKAGRKIVLEEFDEEIVISKTLEVYKELIS